MIDSAKPTMKIKFDMEKALEKSEEKNVDFSEVLRVEENKVIASLTNQSSFNYHFFNDVDVSVYPDKNKDNEYTGLYVLVINENDKIKNEKS